MTDRTEVVANNVQVDPYFGTSLLPMLVAGLVLTLVGMIAAVLLS
jgi:hypothetical protein